MIITLCDKDFDDYWQRTRKELLILDLWSSRAESCRFNAAVTEVIAKDYDETLDIAKISVERNPLIVSEYQIWIVPSIALLYKRKLVKFFPGVISLEVLRATLDKQS